MHQSEQIFITNDTNNQVSVLFSSRRDFSKYIIFTIPYDKEFDLHIPGDYFAVIWPSCEDARLVLKRYCDDGSACCDASRTHCKHGDMITLVPDSKFKMHLEHDEQDQRSREEKARQKSRPVSCRMMYMHREYLESQQRKLYAAEFDIPQHVAKLEKKLISDFSVIEQEEKQKPPGYVYVITNLLETCTVQLLRIYSKEYLSYEWNSVQPARDTLAGRLPELLDYIRDHGHAYISVMQLAKELNVHRCSLSKCFKKRYKITLHDYLQQQRVQMITQMLSDEDTPIHFISAFFGYKNVSGFSKFFRQKTGNTPTQCRRSIVNQRVTGIRLDNMENSLYDH